MRRSVLRATASFTLFFFTFALLAAPVVRAEAAAGRPAAAEAKDEGTSFGERAIRWIEDYPRRYVRRLLPNREKIESPEALQDDWKQVGAETFDGNESVREAESNIMRPVKQVGLNVMDGQIYTIQQFLSFQIARVLKGWASPAVKQLRGRAGEVAGAIGAEQGRTLQQGLMSGPVGQNLRRLLASNELKAFAAREGNFALMAVISVLISSGIYDGLQVDELKDHVIAVGSFATQHTYGRSIPGAIVNSFVSRHIYQTFQSSFERLYGQAMASQSTWSRALANVNAGSEALGAKMLAANRKGLAAGAAKGQNFGEKLGLVGVGEGVKFSVKTLMERAFVGAGYALVGDFAIEAATALVQGNPNRLYLGGDRNRYYARPDINTYRFQKTGNPVKDWLRERSIILENLWDNRMKWPLQSIIRPISTFMGGYVGSVAAGMLFASGAGALLGGTLVSTALAGIGMFFGSWIGSKLDRSAAMMKFRRGNYERLIRRELRETAAYESGELKDEEVERIAKQRALDFEKIEKVGQAPNRILFVDRLENVRVYEDGDYVKMHIPDEHGKAATEVAHTRFDVIDSEGRRGIFDLKQRRLVDVGRVAENSGRSIVFVDGARATVQDGVLVNSKSSPLHVFENGVILEWREEGDRAPREESARSHPGPDGDEARKEGKGEWVARGHAASEDLFFRDTGERFTFENGQFHRVQASGTGRPAAPGPSVAGFDPLEPFRAVLAEPASEEELKLRIIRVAQLQAEQAQAGVESRLSRLGSADDLEAFLAAVRLDESDPDTAERLRDLAGNDMESVRMFLKGRVSSFVSKMGRALGESLESASAEQLREGFASADESRARASETGEAGADPYLKVLRTMEGSPFWGMLSLTRTPDVLGQAVFDTALTQAAGR